MFELFSKGSSQLGPQDSGPDHRGCERTASVRQEHETRPARLAIASVALIVAVLQPLGGRDLTARASGAPPLAPNESPSAIAVQPQQLPAPIVGKQQPTPGNDSEGPFLTPKQRQELLKSNFEKMKHDADDLAALAKSLQQDVGKSSENVLSLKVLDRADKIEKLARKIKSEAKGD